MDKMISKDKKMIVIKRIYSDKKKDSDKTIECEEWINENKKTDSVKRYDYKKDK